MIALELTCAAIVLAYLAMRLARAEDRAKTAIELLALALAAWIGEDSVIRAYGFYAYASGWSLFLDRVPLLIALIWPVVIDSAHVLARRLAGDSPNAARVALVGGAVVLADAALIEPIAVHSHLWSWIEGGVFDVPPIGVLGWALFASAAIFVRERSRTFPAGFAIVILAPAATHAMLVATWWCAFKWAPGAVSPWVLAAVAWVSSAAISATLRARDVGARVPRAELMARAPGAAFFFALLAIEARDSLPLVVYALAFAPPYLVLLTTPSRCKEPDPPLRRAT